MADRNTMTSSTEPVERDSKGSEAAAADQPTDLPRSAWPACSSELKEFKADNLTDLAAALTYYGVLAIFPMIIVVVPILGLIDHSVTNTLIANLGKVAPGPAQHILISAIQNVQSGPGAAGVAFIVGLGAPSGRRRGTSPPSCGPPTRCGTSKRDGRSTRRSRFGSPSLWSQWCCSPSVPSPSCSPAGLAAQAGKVLGVGSSAVTVFDIVKWPVLLLILSVILAILYYVGPNVRQPGVRWVTPGSILAVVLWVIASALFALYVASFSSYNKTYGALAGVIVFLVWIRITNLLILLGAELNAELERGRQIQAGHPAEQEPYLPPRDEPKT